MPSRSRRRPLHATALAAALAAALPVAAGCSGGADGAGATDGAGTVTVSAASSLTEAFGVLADGFSAAHPGASVELNLGASSTLAGQVAAGAPVDVLATADEASMAPLVGDGTVEPPVAFAGNELTIVTRPGNPDGIGSLADLADLPDGGVVALCAAEAPCGRFAAQALDAADVTIPEGRVTRGQNVKATLAAVAEGDAAAGLVYATDAEAAGEAVDAVALPDDRSPTATYPIAVVADTDDRALAEAFVAFVLGAEGRAVLADHGFLPPP